MKKIIAFLLVLIVCMSAFTLAASALFEPMPLEQMKAELDSSSADGEKTEVEGMAFAWDFNDITTEVKQYAKDIEAEIKTATESGRYQYKDETQDTVLQMGIDGLTAVGNFSRVSSGAYVNVYKFESKELAEAYYTELTSEEGESVNIEQIHLSGAFVLKGSSTLIRLLAISEVNSAVKHGEYTMANFDIIGDAYACVDSQNNVRMSIKTPDAAIRMENGELIFGKAQKDYDAESYVSIDAYADVYTEIDYDTAHDSIAGKSFVLSTSVRAAYALEALNGSMEIFRTRSSFEEKSAKVTVDTTLVKYDISTKEISVYSAGTAIKTGIYLSDIENTILAVHIHPAQNTFDFYADGILVVKNAVFLKAADVQKIAPGTKQAASGDMADYTVTSLRLFYTSRNVLKDDILCIDNFAWYFSEEYIEREENQGTLLGRSAHIKDKIYLNFYMNFPAATYYDYTAYVRIECDGNVVETAVAAGSIVRSGDYAGSIKYTAGIDFADIGKEVTVSLISYENRSLFLYSEGGGDGILLGDLTYKTTAAGYFQYLLDEKNWFDTEIAELARAVLNFGTYALIYENGGSTSLKEEELPNFGCAYTAEELEQITSESLRDKTEGEIKDYERTGEIEGLTVYSPSLVMDDDIYISVRLGYSGEKTLTVNGKAPESTGEDRYEYKIYIKYILHMDALFTISLEAEDEQSVIKTSPFHMIVSKMELAGVKKYVVEYYKTMYLCMTALENYLEIRT